MLEPNRPPTTLRHVLWRVSGERASFSPPSVTSRADPRRAPRSQRRTGDACSRKRATSRGLSAAGSFQTRGFCVTLVRGIKRDDAPVDRRRMNPAARILIGAIVVLAFVPGATAWRAPALPKPSGLTVVSSTSSSLGISWNASASGVSYRVYLGSEQVLGSQQVASTTATTYTFRGLTCGTTYRLGVKAVKGWKSSDTAWVVTSTLACSLALAVAACGPDFRLTNRQHRLRRNRLGGHVARRSRPHRFQH